jgi:hypothetical protein
VSSNVTTHQEKVMVYDETFADGSSDDLRQLLDSHEAQKQSLVGRQELLYLWLRYMKQDETIFLFQRFVSTVRNMIPTQTHKMPEGNLRLAWTCVC